MASNDLSSNAGQARIRVLFLDFFVQAARKYGCNTVQLLREVGLTQDMIKAPYAWVRFSQYILFTELVAKHTKSPLLGLELGASFSPADLGPFHVLTMTADSPLEVLRAYIKFQDHWQTHSSLEIHELEEERSELRYLAGHDDIWPRRQDAEFSIASINTCMQQALGGLWRPQEIHFQHDISGHHKELMATFGCPVKGDRPHTAILISNRSMAKRSSNSARPDLGHLKPVLESHLMDLMRVETSQDNNIIEKMRRAISRRLASNSITFFAIASDLGVPERSLRRYLAQSNLSFRDLLQSQRIRRACQLLESGSKIPLEQIAEQLGYADAASFGRAFKNWTGVSPRRYAAEKK